jgi:hypothetical protein
METQVLHEFKNGLICFFDELIDQFPEEGDLVIVRIFLKDQILIEDVMNMFVYHLTKDDHKMKTMIKSRNETYFLDNNFFENMNKNKVIHFKKLWKSGRLDDDDKKVVWRWIDSFVFLADKYMKIKHQNTIQ